MARVLVLKSIVEVLLVTALVIWFSYTSFTPYFRGWSEWKESRVAGWVVDRAHPFRRIPVQMFLDGSFAGQELAELPRPDVFKAGRSADQWNGFIFDLPPLEAGNHEARVYAVQLNNGAKRVTMQEIGLPLKFETGQDGLLLMPAQAMHQEQP